MLQQSTATGNLAESGPTELAHEMRADTRTRAQREAARTDRRRRHGYRPVDCLTGQEVVDVRAMTHEEHRHFSKRVADREALLVMQVGSYIDWLVTTAYPPTPEQAAWLKHAAYECLISKKRWDALLKWERGATRAQKKTKTLGEIAAAAVRRSWY